MTIRELWDHCERVEALGREVGVEVRHINLTTTRVTAPRGERVRLFRTFGPTGSLLAVRDAGGEFDVTASYAIVAVRAWILKNAPEAVDP